MITTRSLYHHGLNDHAHHMPDFDIDRQVLRIVASALSILTTRVVFDQGLHFPLRLLLLHLSAILLWDVVQWLSKRTIGTTPDASGSLTALARSTRSWAMYVLQRTVHLICVVGTLFCEYQAIYHFRSLPALAMLLSPDWSMIACSVVNANISTSKAIAANLACVAGAALILVSESQLSGAGLKLSILGVLFAVGAQLLANWEVDALHEDQEALRFTGIRSKTMVPPLVICVTLAAIFRHEYLIYTPPMSKLMLGTLAINTIAAVVTFQCSGSFFRQTEPLGSFQSMEESDGDGVERMLEPISLQTLVILGGVLLGSSITTTVWQYVGFWVILGVLLWIGRQQTSNATDDTYYTPVMPSRTVDIEEFESELEASDPNERQGGTRKSSLYQVIFIVFCVLFSISPMVFRHTRSLPASQWIPRNDQIDTSQHATGSLDFVISRYNEPADQLARQINALQELPNIRLRNARIVVYSTGDDDTNEFKDNLQRSLNLPSELIVEKRSNVGREAAAYLHHMTLKWDNLSDHTFFMQAEMHSLRNVHYRLQDYLIPETGFLSLSDTHEHCNSCSNCWDHSSWSESRGILENIYARANPNTTCKDFTLTYRGQFIASRSRIHGQGKKLFQDLLDDLVDPDSLTHGIEYIRQPWLPNKKDSLDAPLFGYTIERMWGVIMGCSDERIAKNCPSLLAGSVGSALGVGRVGEVEDCQCLDV